MKREQKVAMTLAAFLGACLTLAGCGNGTNSSSAAAPDLSAQDQNAAQKVSDELNGLYRTISGPSAAHVNAAQLLARRAEQTTMQDCMAEQGLNYGPDFLDAPPMFQEEFADAVFSGDQWLAPLTHDMNIGDSQVDPVSYVKAAVDGYSDFDDKSPNEGTDKQSAGCDAKAGDAFDKFYPPGRNQLYESLSTLVAPFEQRAGEAASDSYTQCMSDAGYEVSAPSDLYEVVSSDYPSPREAPTAVEPGSDAWNSAHETELAATQASNECRAPFQQAGLLELAPALEAWTVKHSTELAQIQRAWDDKLEQAASHPEASQVLANVQALYEGSSS